MILRMAPRRNGSNQVLGAARQDSRVGSWSAGLVVLVLSTGCLWPRSEESIRREFQTYVAGINQCTSASQCTSVFPGCPLGCQVAVPTDHKDAVLNRARNLIAQYESSGTSCQYDCAAIQPVVCEQNHCMLVSQAADKSSQVDAGSATDTTGGDYR